jgi:CRISPR-associated protein Cas5d
MGFGITIRVRGDYALFTRPEMKVERVSYDVITPSAARGIIEAIYWKPAIRWVIDRIRVLNEIQFTNIRRNEVSDKISTREAERRMNGTNEPFFMDATDKRQQRAAMILRDVDYVIDAHFKLTDRASPEDTVEKHYNIVLRRLRRGQHYHAPCLGTREFSAQVELFENDDVPASRLVGTLDLGWMLYDLDFADPADIQPRFFRAELHDGVLDLHGIELKG